MKDLENFHFGEKSFHRNDSYDKVAKHCANVGVHFESFHDFDKDEATYKNPCNMTALNKRFKNKISTSGVKVSRNITEQQKK